MRSRKKRRRSENKNKKNEDRLLNSGTKRQTVFFEKKMTKTFSIFSFE